MEDASDLDAGAPRCGWAAGSESMRDYHDREWGFPVTDDVRLFEKLSLEAFQCGLSWKTILDKREAFRKAFAGFEPEVVASFGSADVERLLGDAGIVRHRGKIEAVISNAGRALELMAEPGGLAGHIWSFEPDPTEIPEPQALTFSPTSTALSKDLKRRGWRFVGPTTAFAFMQSMGLVNDHERTCAVRTLCNTARADLIRPNSGVDPAG